LNRRVQITLDDIAKRLNVSKVTVSKALRNHPDISRETSERVKKIAKELGYTPNYMARNLSSQKSNTIGVVVPKIAHFFFSSLIEAIYDVAFYNNYEIILTVSQENAEREAKHLESLLAMRVDGILVSISQQTRDKKIFDKVKNFGVPLVFIDRILAIPNTSRVTVDDRGGAFKAIELSIQNGYRKIGHLAGYRDISIGKDRYLGFRDALKKYDIPFNPDWVIHGGFGETDGYNGFMKMYDSGNLPEFIFAVTFPVALGICKAAKEVNLKIPDDVDIICFGNSDINDFVKPSISFINQPTEKIGKAAIELLLEQIRSFDDFKPKNIEIPTEIVLKETCLKKQPIL